MPSLTQFTMVIYCMAVVFASACSATLPVGHTSCDAPLSPDSLIAEMQRDTVGSAFGDRVSGRMLSFRDSVVIRLESPRIWSVLVQAEPRYTGNYRIGYHGDSAYRLRGFACNQITDWISLLPDFSLETEADVWNAIDLLAKALNPIGNLTSFHDPDIQAPPDTIPFRSDWPRPTLSRSTDGEWSGTVRIRWADAEGHGMSGATWIFRFASTGALTCLAEDPRFGEVQGDSLSFDIGC